MQRILFFQSHSSLHHFSEACFSLTPKIFAGNKGKALQKLFLDIGATKKYFGGEPPILSAMDEFSQNFQIEGQKVLTDRPEWALAFAYSKKDILVPPGKSQQHLYKLPIERLAYCGNPLTLPEKLEERIQLTAFMKRVGMLSISHFAQLNLTAIHRRFGKLGNLLHQWICGERMLSLPAINPTAPICETLDTEEIGSLETLLFLLRGAFVRIEARLKGRALMAKKLKLTFHLESLNKLTKEYALSEPQQEATALLKLFQEYLKELKWDSPLQRLEIEVSDSCPCRPGQLSLFDPFENRYADIAKYIDRLQSRYGTKAVGFAEPQQSYLPERSWKNAWPPSHKKPTPLYAERPLILFNPARPYSPPKNGHFIPSENLATEWWEKGGFRRYFILKSPQKQRLWIYWDIQEKQWFLQGSFD